jgi:hypothetical protein
MRDGWAAKLASLLTSAAAVAALWFTAQSLQATQNQIGLSEQGQLTDRFGKAVEQMGSDKLDVRLGGIYALERLARDSPRDHPTVMEVLSAFIREHAPTTFCTQVTSYTKPAPGGPTDIQAALTVIGRRNAQNDGPSHLNLTHTCLTDADLLGADLLGADLTNTNLTNANLTGANLGYANLTGANLGYANLTGANLTIANLIGADLTHIDLTNANLIGADLTKVNLTSAHLTNAHPFGANLTGADLTGADLLGADLTGANLTGAVGAP